MLVLHALWSLPHGLRVWGEAPEEPSGSRPRGRARAAPRPHPFACPAEALHEALGAEVPAPVPCRVLLPTGPRDPLPSPEAAPEGRGADGEPARLAPWIVPACTLPPGEALALLLDLDAARAPRVRPGSSLTHLGEVAKLAIELAARGRLLPSLERRDGGYAARWRPLLTEAADVERLRRLGRSMPGVCRAALPDDAASAPAGGWEAHPLPASRVLLRDAVAVLADACARRALAEAPPAQRRGRLPGVPPAARAWLEALRARDSRVEGDAAALRRLARELEEWTAAAVPAAGALVRLCFRLSAPGEPPEGMPPGERWRLDFLLQAADDPSLLLPAERIWATAGREASVLGGRLEDPQEWLLGELGRALRLFAGLQPALRAARPAALELDAAGAHDFLRGAAPLLEQAGFGVLVPPWWSRPGARLAAQLVARPQPANPSGLLGLAGLCEYEWRLALGGETLSPEEFLELARLKEPLVRLRGQWVELRPEDVQAALALLDRAGRAGEMTALEALRLASGAESAPGGLPVESVRGEGWLGPLLEGEARPEPLGTPAGLRGTLRPYQERGLGWLVYLDRLGLGACLADDMGLGKTVQLLALLVREREAGGAPGPGPTLLVCPMSVVGNWQREAERFAPGLRVHVHHGAERLGGEALREAAAGYDLVMTTYALVSRDREALAAVAWARVVLDEAQNVKNPAAKQSQAVRALRASRRVALTGTPVENRLSELWSIMDFLNPGLLGSARAFRERFANPIERFRDDAMAERLRRLTGPFVLRRLKTDRGIIRDLPEKLEMKVYCNLTREQASLYQAVVDDMLRRVEESEGIERKGLVLATLLKLKQVCNHPAQLLQDRSAVAGRSGKLALLEDVLEEALAAGDRTLVFTQFTEMGTMLREHLRARFGREVLFLHGGTPRKVRDAMVARFQADGGPPIFLLSLKAGGTGLNLTAASQVVHFDRWWNPAVEDQATDRAFRIGQTRNVQVRKLVCAGTVEERIDAMIERKKELAERTVGTGEGWLTELSNAELREVVRLSADAVSE